MHKDSHIPPHRISLPLGFSLDMQAIKGGEIWLEDKNHEVSDFFLGTYPVTNEQYAFFLNAYGSDIIKDGQYQGQKMINPHRWGIQEAEAAWEPAFGYEGYPVIHVTWYGAVQFCEWLTEELKNTERPLKVRLPSEAEWELAARGGGEGKWTFFCRRQEAQRTGMVFPKQSWRDQTRGAINANELGLYDMSGNVDEWCESRYDPDSEERVVRGGSWYFADFDCRVSARFRDSPNSWDINQGFRVAGY